ncbi:MAG TPA: RDD family protein [Chitinophagaceae bacterium]|nr:RDD family protein [Chitinophagaceae bacterium]
MKLVVYIRRGFAWLVDILIISFPAWICHEIFPRGEPGVMNKWGPVIALFAWIILYHAIQEYFWHRSIGKRIFRLKVIKTDGSALSLADVFKRNILDPFETLLFNFVGIFVSAITPKNQRLGDLLAKTQVVSSEPVATSKE